MEKETGFKKAVDFLSKNRLLCFSTFSFDSDYPESAMVYYLLDENSNILLLTTPESRKIKNIEKNNKVAVLVGHEVEPVTVQIQGTAKVIEEEETHSLFGKYMEKANRNPDSLAFPPLSQLTKGKGVLGIRILIDKFKYSDFRGREPVLFEGPR